MLFISRKTKTINGIRFTRIKKTKYENTSVGLNDDYIIKIEHKKHPLKLRSLKQEIEIVKFLNQKGCVSCPALIAEGVLETGEPYFIQKRVYAKQRYNTADMVFSLLEQKSFGVCQGDLKPDNFIFDKNSLCYIIDYDQAILDEKFIQMDNIEFLNHIAERIAKRWNTDLNCFYRSHKLHKDEIFSLFKNTAFDLAATSILKKQITTNSKDGIYHTLKTDALFIEGMRDLDARTASLDKIEFRENEIVLDVGCNMGLLCHYLNDRGCKVTGIDMDDKIVIGAKMVANILSKDIDFEWLDLDHSPIQKHFDTICLFSVIHHVKNFSEVTKNIAQKCNRIILECGLKEYGSKPVSGKWKTTSGWEFDSIEKLTDYLETVFSGFKFQTYHGPSDRGRHIISLVKAH